MSVPHTLDAEITCFLLDAIKEAHEDYMRGRKRTVHCLRLVNDSNYVRLHALIFQHRLRQSFSGRDIAATVEGLVDCGVLLEARDEDDIATGFYRDPSVAGEEQAAPERRSPQPRHPKNSKRAFSIEPSPN